jgi:hypothetical protein
LGEVDMLPERIVLKFVLILPTMDFADLLLFDEVNVPYSPDDPISFRMNQKAKKRKEKV